MLAGIKKRWTRKQTDSKECCEDDDKEELNDAFTPPPNIIKISQGKVQLVHQSKSLESTNIDAQCKIDKEHLEKRIAELEAALLRLQKQFNTQCGSPTFEKELRDQLENMNRVMKSKERKQLQTCREHKAMQTRFARQESLLNVMQKENNALMVRIRQYEHCLDDVMRKVVDAIVAEDNLRLEVALLKSRVRDLEEQNAALSASPAKGRDEGYCTMSSGPQQPSNGHLEDLPEEPEQWLLPAEPCSTEMEDWSMSQEELAVITLDGVENQQSKTARQNGEGQDWLWNSSEFLSSTIVETDSTCDGIAQLLQQKIIYSEDEEVACTEFTNDFYKLVNIRSGSARSLYSCIEADTDDEDDDDDDDDDEDDENDDNDKEQNNKVISINLSPRIKRRMRRTRIGSSRANQASPTPSEAGRAQLTSCSSSESEELSRFITPQQLAQLDNLHENEEVVEELEVPAPLSDIEIEDIQLDLNNHCLNETQRITQIIETELRRPPPPPLIKSKSTLDEDEPSCILRNNQKRDLESHVVRSGSLHCNIATNIGAASMAANNSSKLHDRLMQRPANSWRKSNGWKRVTSPLQSPNSSAPASPTKITKSPTGTTTKCKPPIQQKQCPTRIPSCLPILISQQTPNTSIHSNKQLQQNPPPSNRKSKIPPPVPIRRSYAS